MRRAKEEMNARRDKSPLEWLRVSVFCCCCFFSSFSQRERDTSPLSVLFIRSRTSQEEENWFD